MQEKIKTMEELATKEIQEAKELSTLNEIRIK